MAVFITGDTHNAEDVGKIASFDCRGLTRDDHLVILGDFGFVWDPVSEYGATWPDAFDAWLEDECWLDWFEGRPYTTLWIDGNHENFDLLSSYPVESWHGGHVQRIREHVIHLMRGELYSIEGRTFFAMGGAHSTDEKRRRPGKTWWPQEVPDEEERARAVDHLDACGWEVDYVLTHAAPSSALPKILPGWPDRLQPGEYTDWLQSIAKRLMFKRWFHGHYHADRRQSEKFACLYNEIVCLDDAGKASQRTSWLPCSIDWVQSFAFKRKRPTVAGLLPV